jgi:2-polyprenyl-3-methyl-5-hydroxy-6-metoxy-1,4-benzoquinol methylase
MKQRLYKEMNDLEWRHWWFVGRKEIILYLLRHFISRTFHTDKLNRLSILDIGCGCGQMLEAITSFTNPMGMDCSDEALFYCKKKFSGPLKKGCLPSDIPYEKKSIDVVLVLDVLEHVEDDCTSLHSIFDLLKTGGMAIITVPAFMSLWSAHDEVHHHKKRYRIPELRGILAQAGFKIMKISYFNSFLFLPIAIIRYSNRFFKRKKFSDAILPNKTINYLLLKLFSFEKYLLRVMNFRFGVSIIAIVVKKN